MPGSIFPTTRRSVVLALASDDEAERTRAFDTLASIYWKPLCNYARVAHRREDVEDLAQAFLAIAFERATLADYDSQKASFRTFLRLLFDRFVSNEMRAAARLKRGGDLSRVELSDVAGAADPEELFQREWARSVFTVALERLRGGVDAASFEMFTAYDVEAERVSYRDLGQRYGLTETIVTNRLASTRRRFREIVLDLLREITASDQEFRTEARALLGIDL